MTHQIPDFKIPVGLSTKLGLSVSAGLGVISAIEAVSNGDHTTAAVSTLAGAVLTLLQTLGGRFSQAAALLRDVSPGLGVRIPASSVQPIQGGTMGPSGPGMQRGQ